MAGVKAKCPLCPGSMGLAGPMMPSCTARPFPGAEHLLRGLQEPLMEPG